MTDRVYVVHWPRNHVMKVGYTSKRRWRTFTSRGATLIRLYDFESSTEAFHIEDWLHLHARKMLRPAFPTATDRARNLLGCNGAGYRECWVATRAQVEAVIAEALAQADAQALQANAQASSQAMPRTNGRTDGLTQTRTHLRDDISPLVTRALAYGDFPNSTKEATA